MLRYIALRLASAVVMALLASLVIFLISNFVPGDPVLAQLGDILASDPRVVAEWRAKWGLDLPLWDRYLIFLNGLLHGDLGNSIATRRPVLEDIAQYAPATIELATVSFLLSLLVGIPLGVAAARWMRWRAPSRCSASPRPPSGSPSSCWPSSMAGLAGRRGRGG